MNTFSGFWLYATYTNMYRNYLSNQEVRERIIEYIILSDNSRYIDFSLDFLCSQDVSGVKIRNFYFAEGEILNCIFNNTNFHAFEVLESDIDNCDFSNSDHYKTGFYGVGIKNTIFESSNFEEVEFNTVEFENVSFRYCNFRDVDFHKCSFRKMDAESFKGMTLSINAIKAFAQLDLKIDLTESYQSEVGRSTTKITKEFLKTILD